MAGAIPNLLYCICVLRKHHTFSLYAERETVCHWVYAFLMAVSWFGSTSLYGIDSVKLGEWRTILGWPLFMSFIVVTASIIGIATGERKNSGKQPVPIQGLEY